MYLSDGRLPIDNNDVEQLMKQVAMGRKNWLFVGSVAAGERAADFLTLVSSAARNDLDVWAYLKDVLVPQRDGSVEPMTILFPPRLELGPWRREADLLAQHGHKVINPSLPDDDFDEAVRVAQAEFDKHKPDVIVGSSRGGAVAMNIDAGDTPLVLLCPAWKRWGTAKTVKPGTVILHSEADDVIPIAESQELVQNSGLPASALIEIGSDHRLADPEPLEAMLRACVDSCVPEWTDD